MSSSITVTSILLLLTLFVGGASYYTTDVVQSDQLQVLEDSRKVAELTNARVEDLLVREAESSELADAAINRWYARYKYVPDELDTADMLEYVEGLTRTGFEQFDMHLVGRTANADLSTYTFEVTGLGNYSSLYHVIWHLENNREFYRINSLAIEHVEHVKQNVTTNTESRRGMASFKFTLLAYFAGIDGLSAPADSLRPIPLGLFSVEFPNRDIFNPLIQPPVVTAAALPTNTEGLLDIEKATLVSIVGLEATFEHGGQRHAVHVDDRVYLGRIVEINPATSTVRARLVKGNRVEMITQRVGEEEAFRRALGDVQLDAATTDPSAATDPLPDN